MTQLQGFITVPGLISLCGVILAGVMLWLDLVIGENFSDKVPDIFKLPPDAVRPILTTVAAASMAALSLVYSSVLVVFTLAAGNIGPRLLQRFAHDRINQAAVGTLGATFVYALVILRNYHPLRPVDFSVNVSLILAAACVIMLLLFVNSASKRVTIDEEVANIGNSLDKELKRAAENRTDIDRADLVRPAGPERVVGSSGAGYINSIAFDQVAKLAAKHNAFVDFEVAPGAYVIEGQTLARIIGSGGQPTAQDINACVLLGRARSSQDDLGFSVNLLVEIAIRALSPGVNDTFTAIACADRLSAALARARQDGLSSGVYCGPDGAARVSAPYQSIDDLIVNAFGPLRRASRGNILMTRHIVRALGRLGLGKDLPGEESVRLQLQLVRAGTAECDALGEDKEEVFALIDMVNEQQVGAPLTHYGGAN